MQIPLVDTTRISPEIKKEIQTAMQSVIDSGDFVLGKKVFAFESAFAEYLGVKHCVGVGSGTDALLLALAVSGVGEGDEVIIPAMSFIATLTPLIWLRAKPVIVDITSDTYQIDPEKIESAISPRTKAILPVHLYGYLADMEAIKNVTNGRQIVTIEDAAQAHGSKLNNQLGGSFGEVGAFSFYPGKNLGAYGDAGAVVVNNSEIADRLRLLRNHGQSQKYHHRLFGYNSRLDTIQAAVLGVKLKYIEQMNEKRRSISEKYKDKLKNLPIELPQTPMNQIPNYHLFVIQTDKRDALHTYLNQRGIQSLMHYPIPLHLQESAAFLGYKIGDFPNAEKLAKRCLSLPIFPDMTDDELMFVCDEISSFFASSK
jgi:dTDP-4-amino-4,6-dideoxygalactose transaminase